MAILNVTVPTASLPRVRKAFGHLGPPENPVWIDATQADVEAELTDYVKRRTRQYEEAQAAQAAVNAVSDI